MLPVEPSDQRAVFYHRRPTDPDGVPRSINPFFSSVKTGPEPVFLFDLGAGHDHPRVLGEVQRPENSKEEENNRSRSETDDVWPGRAASPGRWAVLGGSFSRPGAPPQIGVPASSNGLPRGIQNRDGGLHRGTPFEKAGRCVIV